MRGFQLELGLGGGARHDTRRSSRLRLCMHGWGSADVSTQGLDTANLATNAGLARSVRSAPCGRRRSMHGMLCCSLDLEVLGHVNASAVCKSGGRSLRCVHDTRQDEGSITGHEPVSVHLLLAPYNGPWSSGPDLEWLLFCLVLGLSPFRHCLYVLGRPPTFLLGRNQNFRLTVSTFNLRGNNFHTRIQTFKNLL